MQGRAGPVTGLRLFDGTGWRQRRVAALPAPPRSRGRDSRCAAQARQLLGRKSSQDISLAREGLNPAVKLGAADANKSLARFKRAQLVVRNAIFKKSAGARDFPGGLRESQKSAFTSRGICFRRFWSALLLRRQYGCAHAASRTNTRCWERVGASVGYWSPKLSAEVPKVGY